MKKITAALLCILMALAFAGCGGETKNPDLSEIMTKLSTEIKTDSDSIMEIKSADKLIDYYGIKSDDVESFAIKMNASGVDQEEVVMIKAKSADSASTISSALEKHRQSKEDQMNNYLPEQYEIVKKSKVSVNGNYVSLFISENSDKMTEIYNSYF